MILTQLPIRKFRRVMTSAVALFFCIAYVQADDTFDAPSAFAVFKEQAELGEKEAQYNLGVIFETGWSVPVDSKKAVRWFLSAAKQGHANAQLRLGMLYYLGIGSAQSNLKGEKWIRKSAKQGQPLAEAMNRALFIDGLPGTLTPSATIKQVRQAYLEDESSALAVLEKLLRQAQQQELREEKVKQRTTLRERRMQRENEGPLKPGFVSSAELERVPSEVPAFFGEASIEEKRTLARGSIATIRLQAEEGLASAQHNLGRMYELGIRLPLDKQRALEWYEKSARQGYAVAEYRLAIAYLYGVGVKRDELAGKKWLALAARHGHSVAKNMMSEFANNSGVLQQSISLAVRWYLERALAGDGQAAFHLGKVYEHGWGVRANLTEALKWYRAASHAGIKQADALSELVQTKLDMKETAEEPGQLVLLLRQYGLPVWLANPLVILSFLLVMLSPLLVRWWSGRRGKVLALEEKIPD